MQPTPFSDPPSYLVKLASLCIVAAEMSCSAAAESPMLSEPPAASGGASGGATSAGGSAGATAAAVNPLGRARCQAPAGASAFPQNTEQAVQLLNALPKPTSVACFVESLARPLTVYATSSTFSAQPAFSAISPRVFIKLGQLWISVVLDGNSSYLIEFGALVSGTPPRSIKGELELPMNAPVAASAPYDRVRMNDAGTGCGLCHYNEERDSSIGFAQAFSSIAFRPRPETRVSIDSLRIQDQTCDWRLESHRCEMLSALFGGGAVEETPFPDTMATFF